MRRKRTVHGESKTRLYECWQNMLARTTPGSAQQKYTPSYEGVGRDPKWDSFLGFKEDMGDTYFPGAALARLGDTGNYTASNCRWVTKADNAKERTKHFTSDGRPAVDVAVENGVPRGTFYNRILYKGYTVDEAVVR